MPRRSGRGERPSRERPGTFTPEAAPWARLNRPNTHVARLPAANAAAAATGLTPGEGTAFIRPVHLRAILFDYGGTLDGAASHWFDRMCALYEEAGVVLPVERAKRAFYRADAAAYADPRAADMSLAELMAFHVGVQLQELGLADDGLRDRLAGAFVARSHAAMCASRRVLERLAGHYRLGVVSNFYGNVGRILADAGIAPLLHVIADSTRVGCMKPDGRIFAHALAALGTAPGATLHVGDSYERDVCAARAVGLRTAWLVAPEGRPTPPGCVADLVLCSLAELEPALAGGAEAHP